MLIFSFGFKGQHGNTIGQLHPDYILYLPSLRRT